MSKILTVTRAEYVKATRSKAFVIGVLLTPLLFSGSIVAMAISKKTVDVEERRFAVVDRTGALYAAVEDAAEERNATALRDESGEKQVLPAWVPSAYAPDDAAASDDDVLLELSERVESKDLAGFLVIGADIVSTGTGGDREFSWHTKTPTYKDLPRWLERVVNGRVRAERFAAAELDEQLVETLSREADLRTVGLTERDEETGEVIAAEEESDFANLLVPAALALMMFMLVIMSVPALMNNVLEEKMQKIAEVLVSSVTPFELLMGKLFSAVCVSLTLGVLYVGGALLFVHNVDDIPPQVLDAIGPGILAWFAFFLLLALLIFGSMFSALGSACSELQDAQTMMMPAMILMMLPMFFLGPVIENPGGSLATTLSLVPPFTPLVMFLRMAIPPGVEWWQLGLAVVLTTGFTVLCVMASAKIFRIGILSAGQTPNYRKLVGWVLSK